MLFTTMFKAHCPSEDKYIVAPEVFQFSVAPEIKSLYLPIDLVVQALTAKNLLVPVLVVQIRESQTDDFGRYCSDAQMRERLHSLISEHQVSKLYGLSLFGTRMQIYTLDLAISNSTIYPQQEPYLPTAGNVHNY